jgi:hypothetical protein
MAERKVIIGRCATTTLPKICDMCGIYGFLSRHSGLPDATLVDGELKISLLKARGRRGGPSRLSLRRRTRELMTKGLMAREVAARIKVGKITFTRRFSRTPDPEQGSSSVHVWRT